MRCTIITAVLWFLPWIHLTPEGPLQGFIITGFHMKKTNLPDKVCLPWFWFTKPQKATFSPRHYFTSVTVSQSGLHPPHSSINNLFISSCDHGHLHQAEGDDHDLMRRYSEERNTKKMQQRNAGRKSKTCIFLLFYYEIILSQFTISAWKTNYRELPTFKMSWSVFVKLRFHGGCGALFLFSFASVPQGLCCTLDTLNNTLNNTKPPTNHRFRQEWVTKRTAGFCLHKQRKRTSDVT